MDTSAGEAAAAGGPLHRALCTVRGFGSPRCPLPTASIQASPQRADVSVQAAGDQSGLSCALKMCHKGELQGPSPCAQRGAGCPPWAPEEDCVTVRCLGTYLDHHLEAC